jgi:hypothetical protein
MNITVKILFVLSVSVSFGLMIYYSKKTSPIQRSIGIWSPNTSYDKGFKVVENKGSSIYLCLESHTSSDTFGEDTNNWDAIIIREKFNIFNDIKIKESEECSSFTVHNPIILENKKITGNYTCTNNIFVFKYPERDQFITVDKCSEIVWDLEDKSCTNFKISVVRLNENTCTPLNNETTPETILIDDTTPATLRNPFEDGLCKIKLTEPGRYEYILYQPSLIDDIMTDTQLTNIFMFCNKFGNKHLIRGVITVI